MARFLLIHGSCHGAWCWRDVIPALRARGHEPVAIDLPGHGEDRTDPATVTLDMYRDAVLAASDPDTILVGHSMAGFPIAAAANADPAAMRGLVFLCAYVPENGKSLSQMRRKAPRQPLLSAIRKSEDGLTFTIDPDKAPEVFYNDCPEEAVTYALPRLGAQAVAPQETPLTFGPGYDDVPKVYIRCADDRTIPPEYQKTMTEGWPRGSVHVLPSGHSPFFSDPERLAELLNQIERSL